jgi:hypothetical protein
VHDPVGAERSAVDVGEHGEREREVAGRARARSRAAPRSRRGSVRPSPSTPGRPRRGRGARSGTRVTSGPGRRPAAPGRGRAPARA